MRNILLSLLSILIFIQVNAQTTIDTAVNFSAKDINGQTHILYDLLNNGKLVVIDFFSTSCGPCGTYAPHIQESYAHFGMNSGNVYFLGISWGDDNQGVHIFDSTYGIGYPSVSGTQGSGNQINIAYNVLSFPTVILILPDKSIKEKHIWPPTTAKIDSVLIANGGITTSVSSEFTASFIQGIWPNPVSEKAHLSLTLSKATLVQSEIIDMTGRIVLSGSEYIASGSQLMEFDLSHLPKGLYVVKLKTGKNKVESRRLIKK